MPKTKDVIEEVIENLKKINEDGIYSNTINALEKLKSEFQRSEKPDDTENGENEDS